MLICYAALILFSTGFLEWIRTQNNPFQGEEEQVIPEDDSFIGSSKDSSVDSSEHITEVFIETAPPGGRNRENPGSVEQVGKKDDVEMTVEDVSANNPDDFNPDEGALGEYDPTLDLPKFQYPPLSLLMDYDQGDSTVTNEELISNKNRIVETLGNYNIKIDKIKATIGPTVTLYEIVPAPGIRISKIKSLEDDIALSLSALGIRIIAPIPGKGTIGIEVPNQNPRIVSLKSILSSRKFQDSEMELAIALGKTIANETFVFDLTKMPHLLVAGATGQGKSVGLNAIIASLLFKKHPAQLKFVMIDPKKVELSLYRKIERHYLARLPESEEAIITDTQQVIHTLNSLCVEMDDRYNLLKNAQVRNIKEYNTKFINRKLNPNKGNRFMPFIVVIIDEFADLIMT
ncbi:MAG: DNA translocase FtsK, partial [Bacteroidales bacterium]|nr:DNA translocase FtsK [Bacteroidales bacterium]